MCTHKQCLFLVRADGKPLKRLKASDDTATRKHPTKGPKKKGKHAASEVRMCTQCALRSMRMRALCLWCAVHACTDEAGVFLAFGHALHAVWQKAVNFALRTALFGHALHAVWRQTVNFNLLMALNCHALYGVWRKAINLTLLMALYNQGALT